MKWTKELWNALTVRFGIGGGCILGGFVGYWIGTVRRTGEQETMTWPVIVGAAAGFALAAAVLTWLAWRHPAWAAIAGTVVTIAAVVVVLGWMAQGTGG